MAFEATYSPFVTAADTSNMQAGGASWYSQVADVFTKGAPAAVLSGINSIYNTGVDVANIFGANAEHADTLKQLDGIDENWANYYRDHRDVVDTAGYIAGSLVPGTIAIKGLKLAQAGVFGNAAGRVLGYTSSKEKLFLNAAMNDLATEGGTVFSRINGNKLASMAWGTADSTLQMAAFETASAAVMHASPIFEGKDLKDIAWDGMVNTVVGGGIGGGISALLTNKLVKTAGKFVGERQRMADIIDSTGEVNLALGDKAFGIVDSILDTYKRSIDGKIKLSELDKRLDDIDISPLLATTKKATLFRGVERVETEVNGVAADMSLARPFATAMTNIVKQGLETGADHDTIRARVADYMLNLRGVQAIGDRLPNMTQDMRFFDPNTQFTKTADLFRNVRGSNPDSKVFRVIGDENAASMGVLGKDAPTLEEGFLKGFDFVLDPQTKKVMVNPDSKIYTEISKEEEKFSSLFLNTSTLQTSITTVPTIADVQLANYVMPNGKKVTRELTRNSGGVQAGTKNFAFKTDVYNEATDSVAATARHWWAADLAPGSIRGEIDINDISLMDSLLADRSRAGVGLKIVDRNTGAITDFSQIHDFQAYVFDRKMEAVQKLLESGTKDLRDVAYRANVTTEWLDNAISSQFASKQAYAAEGWMPGLERFGQRENVILRYDTARMQAGTQFPDALAAWNARVSEAQDKAAIAAKAVLGKDGDLLMDIKQGIAKDMDGSNVGAGFFAASNANYGDRAQTFIQATGSLVAKMIGTRVDSALSQLQVPAAALLANPKAAAEVAAAVTKLRLSDKAWALWQDARSGEFRLVDLQSYKAIQNNGAAIAFKEQIPISAEAGEFLNTHRKLHAERINQQTVLNTAVGQPVRWDPDRLYLPPVNTQRVPFFAFVRQNDGTIFGSSEVAMITARDAGELQSKIAAVQARGDMQVITKDGTERYHKAKGDYDFSRAMNEPVIDSTLRKQGLLGDYMPNMTPQAVVEDFVQYTQRAEAQIVRDAVGAKYAQPIAELQDLSERYTAVQKSKFEGLSQLLQRNVTDPYGDAIKGMFNISKQGEFRLWNQANEFVDAVGTKAYRGMEKAFIAARGGQIDWQEANDTMRRFGFGPVYNTEQVFKDMQFGTDRSVFKIALNKANSILATTMLRIDHAASLLNVISTPILLGTELRAIKSSIQNDPELFARINDLVSVKIPGSDVAVPSVMKLMYNAVKSYATTDAADPLLARFRAIGAVKGDTEIFHDMMKDLALTPNLVPAEWTKTVDKWVDKAAAFSGANRAEEFTRYVTAHTMHQITEPLVLAGKMSEQEANAFIGIFTNRVQGNYVASQRPIMFQGTIGNAIGLFQTYQFNVLQQLFRHIENRDLKTIATMAGLQSSIYGLNGLPYFDAINTQLIGGASINTGHNDAYSYAVKAVGKEAGDWLMYGTASAFPLFSEQAPALYTRGDMNPRNAFITPTSPLDVPAVAASIKAVTALINMGKQIGDGASAKDALLFGLEHNGLSRPLAGLAQVLKGNATTNQGDLISASSDWQSIATASRLMGAKPMDESIAMSTIYRNKAYQAMDKDRIDVLGQVIKDKLRKGDQVTSEDWIDLQHKYAASGGRVENFSAAIQRWDQAANGAVVNSLMQHSRTPAGQRLITVMGGTPLPDYRNVPMQ